MYRRSLQLTVAVAILAAAVVPQTTSAQSKVLPGTPAATARAAVLEASADRLLVSKATWRTAARLLEEAAALRPAGDRRAVKDLVLAAGAYYYSGRQARGRETYVVAAERALADGDIETAAHIFLVAAIVANQMHDGSAAELRARGERLAASPLLNESQRRVILGWFRPAGRDVVATSK